MRARTGGRATEARWRLLSCLPSGTSSTGIVRILLSRVHACTCEHNAAQHTTRGTSYNFGYAIRRSTSAARTIEVSDYNFACISSKTVATQSGLLLSGTANSP
ncbi:hypothetical protein ALC53_07155 [Atta colombica]|uniref:Uncharacterized protein n=1 Tax=Atta colombica TaxID=520822 RepID=A0A195BDT5_9HYME|nr:hypothetical protein ALC53_07155 [Atta colombica]